jgi:hypothetical protein
MSTQETFPPNLDAMDKDELREFGDHVSTLSQYVSMKLMAMDNRKDGDIADAIRVEAHCERLYQLLPKEWRW